MANQLWTVSDVADYIRMSESYICHHLREIPHMKFGATVRFTKEDIDTWIAAKRRGGATIARITKKDLDIAAANHVATRPRTNY